MKRIIYIDFENVSTAGLNGILDLNEKDHVKIFLGPKCSKLSLIEAEAILHCHATVELITNEQIGKNALDFIIMVHMGYDIAKKAGKAFYIISNDKGYEPAIHEMQSMTGLTIERLSDIRQMLNEEEPAKGGLLGLFSKKNKQVHNMTEHEVYEKGKRVGQAKRSTRADVENRGSGDRQRNGKKSSGGEGARDRNGQNRNSQNRNNSDRNAGGQTRGGASQKSGSANRAGKQNTAAKLDASGKTEKQTKRDGLGKPETVSSEPKVSRENPSSGRESQPNHDSQPNRERRTVRRSTRKENQNRNLEDLSVAELAKELGIERTRKAESEMHPEPFTAAAVSKPEQKSEGVGAQSNVAERSVTSLVKVPEPIVHVPAVSAPAVPAKKETAKRPAPMTAEEKALVAQAIEVNEDKEAYHNYLMAELHDTQRATELYKLSRNRFLKAKAALKAEAEEKKQPEEAVAEESEAVVEKSEAVAEAITEESETVVKKAEAVAEESETVAKKAEAVTEEAETVVGEMEAARESMEVPTVKSEAQYADSESVPTSERDVMEKETVAEGKAEEERLGMEAPL